MCIIAVKPAAARLSAENLFNMWMNNPHGAGFMFARDGKLEVVKGLMTFSEFVAAYEKVQDEKLVIHFRWRTHGPTTKRLTHPFLVRENTGMVHNGVIPKLPAKRKESDTSIFAKMLQKRDHDPMASLSDYQTRIALMIEIGLSKLVFMNGQGDVRIVNGKMGHFEDGVWYSNHSYTNHETYDAAFGAIDYDPRNWKVSTKLLDL